MLLLCDGLLEMSKIKMNKSKRKTGTVKVEDRMEEIGDKKGKRKDRSLCSIEFYKHRQQFAIKAKFCY
jgi:hypothetical protein